MGGNMGGNHRSNGPDGDNWDLVRLTCHSPLLPVTNDDPFARFVPPPPPSNNNFASFPLLQSLTMQHEVPEGMEWQPAPYQPLPTDPATVVGSGGSGYAISVPQPEDLPDSEEWNGKVVLWESPITVDDLFQELLDSEECNEKMVLWESPITVDDLFQELFDSQKPPEAHPTAAPPVPSVKLPAGEHPLAAGPDKTVPSSVGGDAAGSSSRRTKRMNQDMEVMTQVRNDPLRLDSWAWLKCGHKSRKGSVYLRSYYKCTSDSDCTARRYVECCCDADPNCHIVSYQSEHCHPSQESVGKGFARARINGVPPVKNPAVAEAPAPPPSPSAKITGVGDPPHALASLDFAPAKLSPSLKFSTIAQAPAAPPPPAMASVWDIPLAPSHLPASASASPLPFFKIPAAEEKGKTPALLAFESAWLSLMTTPLGAPSLEFDEDDFITLGKLLEDAEMKMTSDSVPIVIPENEPQDDLVLPTSEELAPVYYDSEENMQFPLPYERAPGTSNAGNNNNNQFPMPYVYVPAPGGGGGGSNNNLMMFSMPYEAAPGGSNSNLMFQMPYKPAPSSGGDGNTRMP